MRINRNSTPARILDRLETEGGWLTEAAIERMTEASSVAVHRALYRLRDVGWVESRPRVKGLPGLEWRIFEGSSLVS